jgi:DNA-binding MarR family transcriptional regulator
MASPGLPESSARLLRGLVLLQRVTVDLARDAEVALGEALTARLDLKVLLAIHASGGVSPSELVESLGLPRSTLARALGRLRDEGVLVRDRSDEDGRRAELRLSPLGHRRVDHFVAASRSTFVHVEPTLREALLLLGRDVRELGREPQAAVLVATDRVAAAVEAFGEDLVPVMRQFGLTERIDRAGLLVVAERGSARPTRLARETGLTPAGVTSLVDRLVDKGIVVRDRGVEGDGRAVVVRLTERGLEAAEAYLSAFRPHQAPLLDAFALTMGHARAAATAS